jgi:hypothetical protein
MKNKKNQSSIINKSNTKWWISKYLKKKNKTQVNMSRRLIN